MSSSPARRRPPHHRPPRWRGAARAAVPVLAVSALLLPGGGPAHARPEIPGPAPSIPLDDPATVAPVPGDGATRAPDTSRIAADGIRPLQYWLDEYGVREAWEESTGEGVRIAVIDTGVDGSHQDLAGAVVGGTDVSGGGAPDGQEGLGTEPEHGTLVASVAAGRGHTAPGGRDDDAPGRPAGIVGVAPDAEVLAVSTWLGNESAGVRSVDEQLPDAVRWAVDNGADVINMSVGSNTTSWPESWDDAFLYAEEQDVLVVASAGNRGSGLVQVGAPATIPGVLTVGGVSRTGEASWESSSQGISIAVAGPSEAMVGAIPGDRYATWAGTSASAPVVAGTAALIKAKWPDMSSARVANRIVSTARDTGAPGKDPLYGYGVLDVEAALTEDVPEVDRNPLGSMEQWVRVHRRSAGATPTAGPTGSAPPGTDEVEAEVAPPEPVAPLDETGLLPVVVLAGFGLLVLGLTAGAVVHIRRIVAEGPDGRV
ncbi:S8 family serine peptidase [Kocuria kalidii]|uniref:S8 family serine peptidase n=1 Tax=Kocuria kalidii TaxID=3376283 RepID=UPI0037BA38D9